MVCRDFSVAPVVMKLCKVLLVDNLITRNLSCQDVSFCDQVARKVSCDQDVYQEHFFMTL